MPETALKTLADSRELAIATAQVLADIVRLIVAIPDRVRMKTRPDGKAIVLRLTVAPDDIGKVIGRQGRTVRSLRVILGTISSKTGTRFELDVQAEPT